MKELKNISTAQLVAELSRRENVELFECDHYRTRTRVKITDDNMPGVSKVITPMHCDVLLVSRPDKYLVTPRQEIGEK